MRLDKLLALHGYGTRSHVKEIIKASRVKVNTMIITNPAYKIDENKDMVVVDNHILAHQKNVYYMLNKPAGYICAHRDHRYPSVLDLLEDQRKDLIMVGRLDVDTEGLLLICNDGLFSHHVSHGKQPIFKEYYVELEKPFDSKWIAIIEAGMMLDDERLKPGFLTILAETKILLSISQGKYHQVKRMMKACDNEVLYLKRTKIGQLSLDDQLEVGQYRQLTQNELDAIFL